ncbi:Eukaryotic translation initiation factor 6 [Spraguea lophii 42_110]|uniref:Eukaryotic translation initiation factor 6 n=1 Tax=Spraguea lophii (strain 42_110) TaxID=1358809 RepID=S7XW72_SPRLO|nr:Eukaryotic translation initiation factor 6 [Spraguea lophii 42_110]
MAYKLDFEGSNDVGAHCTLTNSYCIIGQSTCRNFYSVFEERLDIPIVETRINSIRTVGSLCCGNNKGLLLPQTASDQEVLHIRNSLPDGIRIKKIDEKLNALGNVICCNDKFAIVNPDLDDGSIEIIQHILGVEVIKRKIGPESLVGSFAVMNNRGLLVHPSTSQDEMEELKDMLGLAVIAGTVNMGSTVLGAGLVVNDWIGFTGNRSTQREISVIDSVFKLTDEDEETKQKAWIEDLVK